VHCKSEPRRIHRSRGHSLLRWKSGFVPLLSRACSVNCETSSSSPPSCGSATRHARSPSSHKRVPSSLRHSGSISAAVSSAVGSAVRRGGPAARRTDRDAEQHQQAGPCGTSAVLRRGAGGTHRSGRHTRHRRARRRS
jgi:hypothetical protein